MTKDPDSVITALTANLLTGLGIDEFFTQLLTWDIMSYEELGRCNSRNNRWHIISKLSFCWVPTEQLSSFLLLSLQLSLASVAVCWPTE